MKKLKHSRLLPITGLLLGMLVWLANNGNPPTGNTAAPFNGNCNGCHSGGNFNGSIDVSGFPATAVPGVVYDITLTMNISLGAPPKAGFQLVVVDGNDDDCGDLSSVNGQTGTEMLAGREYIEHRGGKAVAGGMVSWDFKWEAPASVPGNTIKAYYIVNLVNGNGGTGGDNPVWDNLTFDFAGPPPVGASISSTVNPTCNGKNDGSATVEPTGGNPPYTYAWTGGQTGQTAVNLVAGTYTVTVTAAAGSGTATATAVLTQPPALTLNTSISGTVTCVSSATVTATAGGGTPVYTFVWSDGQTGNVATFDDIGLYTVTATDMNGCTKIATANIMGNKIPPVVNAGPEGTLTCAMPQLQLNGAGSSTGAIYTYNWVATNGGNIVSGSNTLTPTINACGTYTLTVTNTTNGCTSSASTVVNCMIILPNASATGGSITCTAGNVTLMGMSATPNVSYKWSGPGINPGNQNQQNPSVDQAGTYTLTVTDPSSGCTKTATAVVVANNTPPTAIGSVTGPLTCTVSPVQLNLTTNAPNPVFAWTGPNNFNASIANPTVSSPGDYYAVVTNPANGCKGFDTITVVQNIVSPGATAVADGQITCVNDTVQLTGNSPAAPNVSYAWTGLNFSSSLQNPLTDTAGTYTLKVTGTINGCTSTAVVTVLQNLTAPFDSIVPPGNLNCNHSSLQLNATPSSQGPNFDYLWTVKNGGHIVSGDTLLTPVVDSIGKYFLKITNTDNGCTALDSVVVNLSPAVTASIPTSTNVSCNGGTNGSASVAGAGGNAVFTYLWSNGASTASITGLSAGTYGATVTDGENCSAMVSVDITQPDLLQANASATGETALGANNGTATVNPTGGTAGYTYAWSNNASTQTITNLAPDSYTVSITDSNGCTAIQTVTVNAFGCSIVASATFTNVTCNGANNGTGAVNLSGAVNPVSYAWSNGASTQSVSQLSPGTYTVQVLDGNNCPAELSISISEPPVLSANASATNVTALGATDGTASATPTGGTPNYQYAWSNFASTQAISGLAPGNYSVTVSDENGCTAVQTVSVSAFNCAISATISSAEVSCFGGSDGQATIAVSGGTLPYTYVWSNNATTQTVGNLSAGTYTATAIDDAGCAVTQSITIGQPDLFSLAITSITHVLCPQDMTGQVSITGNGGTPPYSYSWPGGNSGNFGVGNYTVNVTDANGCIASIQFSIVSTDNQAPVLTCPSTIQSCGAGVVNYGLPSVTDNCGVDNAPVVISGPASGSVFAIGNTAIVYRATDASGNSATCFFSVVVTAAPGVLLDNVINDVNGQGLGSISITANGSGSLAYAWYKDGQPFAVTEDLSGLQAGTYSVIVTDLLGCTAEIGPIILTNTVGASEPGLTGSIKLWPNPAFASIQLEIIDLDVIAACIVDLQGKLLRQIDPVELSGAIDIQSLPEGMYGLKLGTSDGRVLTLRFMKQ